MNQSPEQLALQHSMTLCQGHAEALLGWLASADEWQTLRQIRNQFAHDYPDNALERFERLQAAIGAAAQLMSVLTRFQNKSKSQMTG
jgi:hypothetical protein